MPSSLPDTTQRAELEREPGVLEVLGQNIEDVYGQSLSELQKAAADGSLHRVASEVVLWHSKLVLAERNLERATRNLTDSLGPEAGELTDVQMVLASAVDDAVTIRDVRATVVSTLLKLYPNGQAPTPVPRTAGARTVAVATEPTASVLSPSPASVVSVTRGVRR
ncbi:hypothetical protein ACQPZG_31865 [Streptomyces sp. CA-294286]|uniref:hypothetical protein n=1 Tax=Streptomyces sp. CA-294286 TaxID=3240070 RepID=UPI003D9119B2